VECRVLVGGTLQEGGTSQGEGTSQGGGTSRRGGTLQGADTLQGEGTLQGGGMLEEASNYLGSVADTHLTGYVCLGGKFDGQFSSNNFVIDDGFGEAAYVEMTPV